MAGNSELFQALGMLQNSVKGFGEKVEQLKTQRALNNANLAVDDIRRSEATDFQKENALRGVASSLAGTIGIEGAQGFAKLVAPEQKPIQSTIQALTDANPRVQQAGQAYEATQQQYKLQQEAQKATANRDLFGVKNEAKANATIAKRVDQFGKEEQFGKNELAALAAAEDATGLSGLKTYTALNILKNKVIKASGDNKISDSDRAAINGDPSLTESAKRAALKYLTGDVLEKDIGNINDIFQALKTVAENRVKAKATSFSQNARRYGATPNELEQEVLKLHRLTPVGVSATTQAPAGVGVSQPGSLKSILIPRGVK